MFLNFQKMFLVNLVTVAVTEKIKDRNVFHLYVKYVLYKGDSYTSTLHWNLHYLNHDFKIHDSTNKLKTHNASLTRFLYLSITYR